MIGLVEEVGKIIVVAYYVKKTNARYILNGLLIGACVGAGFAVFETAGYIFNYYLAAYGSLEVVVNMILLRGALSVGGHVIWTAIAGAALVAAKGEKPFDVSDMMSSRFLFFLGISIVLHGLWDCPLMMQTGTLKCVILSVIGWGVTLTLISSGLKQIARFSKR